MPKTRNEYLAVRKQYEPERIALVIVAESPPASGLYFYDKTGRTTEPLFKALMLQLGVSPTNKEEGLREFQGKGWVLVDATYEPVNELKGVSRNRVIERDYPQLRGDLEKLLKSDRASIPLILIKANVCQLLRPTLVKDKFYVLNGAGCDIPFPSHGQQKKFHQRFAAVSKRKRRN